MGQTGERTTKAASGSAGDASRRELQRFRVSAVSGPAAGRTWTSVAGKCTVGAEAANDVAIDDATVSRFHCEISIEGGALRVRDLGSRNGTISGDTRIVDGFVGDGATLVLGTTWLRLSLSTEVEELPASEADSFGSLVGGSLPMRIAFAALEKAARSSATVLLTGETGTGKEEAALSIHETSDRRDRPFVVVDCGALPAELLESELFGHEKGAFTGATATRLGAFEDAQGGTIFLDEIGELPLEMQPKLLRVLERKQIRRLGSNRHKEVDVRVIAATHRDLRAEVNRERFRGDLYYRLAVICVELPPLRARPEDIAPLARHLLAKLGSDDPRLDTEEFMAQLRQGAWPGNVRELRNYLERAVVLGRPPPLEAQAGDAGAATGSSARPAVDASLPYHEAKRRLLEAFERDYVAALLQAHGGKVTQAAEAAGIGRVLLWRLARRHGLS